MKFKLVEIYKDTPTRYAAISAENAKCVYIEEYTCADESKYDNDIYELRGNLLIGTKDSISFHYNNGIFAIYSKTEEGYEEVGLFFPSKQEVDNLPTWIKTDSPMDVLTEKINS